MTLKWRKKRNVVNKRGEPFNAGSLRQLLTNMRYIGKWELNRENKEKDQKRLMSYQRYDVVDLPHGPAIPLDLWERVQKAVAEIASTRMRDADARRTYPLTLLLKYQDGSTFAGQGAWSRSHEKHCYYWNKKNNIRIAAEAVESKAADTIRQIIGNSKELKDALERRGAQRDANLKNLDQSIRSLKDNLKTCDEEERKLRREQ